MELLISLILSTIAVFAAGYILPGVRVDDVGTAVVVAIVLGLINTIIRPIVLFLTMPLNILTLGLFTFVVMGFMVLLVSAIVSGFIVDSIWWAMAFALIFAVMNNFLRAGMNNASF